ncbi:MAG: aspartate kinase [SAR202 cluster bacterium]|jgi:aspartate kinase|nr:MAG: aspartate kinase [SAR202 cluster bacterium]MCH2530056.1 aspartate kinase [Dehalococcoidia bacterium]KAA1299979.1 MAG: aspartate kinase [SAR202 cluster bacterium]KAA1305698.1 MAG: aspartate kinase [SAR202 cluster bacterium]MDP6960137.1 aspartate kinase [Dehalococcoidia bacterium]|tara:strand:+ start:1433 stop:2680 length:1248 start_codon:yes stop_codon:yes gene_type:complete
MTINVSDARPVVVQKYGGSSLADAEHIHNVAARIQLRRDDGVDVIVVVSAMGDSTDELISLSEAVAGGTQPDAREMDTLLSTGELVSSTLMAMALKARGCDSISLSGIQAGIKTDAVHGSARIADINTDRIRTELDKGRIVIVAGFQGLAESGDITTLGRGGSDTTAVALAVAVDAERCEIYTDVDGIYTTDPRLTDKARKLSEIGFDEMLEMAVLGAKMNPRSIELGAVYDMPVYVASSFSSEPGTLIHGGEQTMEVRKAVTGIAVDSNVAKITVRGVVDRPGVAAGLLKPLADEGVSVDVIVQNTSSDGTTDFTFTVGQASVVKAAQLIEDQSVIEYAEVITGSNLAKVSIVGTGMENAPGYAARMFSTLSEAKVNIDMITTSEIRITTIIDREQVQKAVQSLHDAFELEKSQ